MSNSFTKLSGNSFARAIVIAAAVLLAPACASQSTSTADDPATGELVFPLSNTGASGTLYVLDGAAFQITDATGAITTIDDDGSSAAVLSAQVPPGIATIELQPGWTLLQSHDGGVTLEPVNAQLASINPQTQRVLVDTKIQIAFNFIATDPDGTLQIAFGVDDQPNKLVGGYNIATADGELAAYAGTHLDFAFYFGQPQLTRTVLVDGSKALQYTVSSGNLATPAPLSDVPFAAAFFNDPIGTLSGPIAAELAAGGMGFVVSAAPDGTMTLSGSIEGGDTTIQFGPSVIDVATPPLDADGFPTDAFFDAIVAFTQTSFQGTLTGSMQMRHALPGQ